MIRAKKSLGQNFLKSERALSAIIGAGKIIPGENVLEIGPGHGALTERLLATGAKVIAVEKDDELYKTICEKFAPEISVGNLSVIHGDILEIINEDRLRLEKYKLIANIPYNITGAIFEKFLSAKNQPEQMVLLVQKEVAERIVVRDGKESILSISIKAYGTPRFIDTVKAGSFVPAPKVDSAIISIENISKELFDGFSEEEFFRMLKSGFSSKRKKLSSNLSKTLGKEKIIDSFQKMGLNDNLRAENISIEAWKELARRIFNKS